MTGFDVVLTTAEVRWFARGGVPSGLHTWFIDRDVPVTAEPARVDHYLLIGDTDALGIKLREGRIEVKQRLEPPRRVAFGEAGVGAVELWRKWGLPLAPVAEAPTAASDSLDAWVAVEKHRWLCDYRIDAGGRPVPVRAPDLTAPTCSVELTEVGSRGQRAWTLAFEATGPTKALVSTLEQVTRHVLAKWTDDELRLEDSFGYPKWLQGLHT